MRVFKFLTGLVIGLLLGVSITTAVASTGLGKETIWNRAYDSVTKTIKVKGV